MEIRRVLLVCSQSLLSESLQQALGREEDIELVGPWDLDYPVLEKLREESPDIVIVVEGVKKDSRAAALTAAILERYCDLPVIRVGLTQGTVRVYTSQALPARVADLMDAIHNLSTRQREAGRKLDSEKQGWNRKGENKQNA